jgi:NDP-sugar pyrophosphorylase family protein
MTAMILAAGKGTRLRPLTDNAPKALINIDGKPLLQHAIEKIKSARIDDVVINVHHFAEMIIDFIAENDNFGISIKISDEREELLDTGGGIKKAAQLFQKAKPILIYNADILSDIDLRAMIETHKQTDSIATLAVRNRKTSRYLLFKDGKLAGKYDTRQNISIPAGLNHEEYDKFGFSGIHVISPELLDLIEETGVFSITDVYLRLAQEYSIQGFDHSEGTWFDCGKYEEIKDRVSPYEPC